MLTGKDLDDVDVKVKFISGLSSDNKKRAEEVFYQKLERLRKLSGCDEEDLGKKLFCGISTINQDEVKLWGMNLPLDELIERLETLEQLSE
ncbi:9393_t:CDS:2 [Gigaspora margarita]|uniref:9393_t:CDS:1 n=1 Tax=Gigaspora margarita TaxID=4874 RepID=A0ABM8VWH9_GIGMA|nr:9393_t:CDS:2 [Gigaspora margarita]